MEGVYIELVNWSASLRSPGQFWLGLLTTSSQPQPFSAAARID